MINSSSGWYNFWA